MLTIKSETHNNIRYTLILGVLAGFAPFTINLYLPAFPQVQASFNSSQAAIQLTMTGTMIGFALGQLLMGPLSDKFGRKGPLLSSTSVHLAASLGAAVSPSIEVLGIARFFEGLGAAGSAVIAMAMIRDLFDGTRLVKTLSRVALITGVTPIFAPIVGTWLLTLFQWRGIFYVLALYALIILSCTAFLLPETFPHNRRAQYSFTAIERYKTVLSDKFFLFLLIFSGLNFTAYFSYVTNSSFLFQKEFGLTTDQYGQLFIIIGIGAVTGILLTSFFLPRIGPKYVLGGALIVMAVSITVFFVLFNSFNQLWDVALPLSFYILAAASIGPCTQSLALERNGPQAGTAASIFGAVNFGVSGIVSNTVPGLLTQFTSLANAIGITMALCLILQILIFIFVIKPTDLKTPISD